MLNQNTCTCTYIHISIHKIHVHTFMILYLKLIVVQPYKRVQYTVYRYCLCTGVLYMYTHGTHVYNMYSSTNTCISTPTLYT